MAKKALGPAMLSVVQAVEQLPTAPMLVACSGGADSLALAAAAATVAQRRGQSARAVVIDHRLQAGSGEIAAAVVDQVRKELAIPAHVVTVQVSEGAGPEAAARDARYQALFDAAEAAELILLGHTMDDQAESVLLGLARGSGTRSLAGMPAARGAVRRPLLGLRRTVTQAACAELGLRVWEDPHNRDPRFARVRVRGTVLPVLEAELGPGVTEALARTAQLARDDADLLDQLAGAESDHLGTETIACDRLGELPAALRSRVLRAWLLAAGAQEVGAASLAAVLALVTAWRGQRWVELPGLRVTRRDGLLHARVHPS